MDRNYILSVIWDYADEYLREPRSHLPKGCFEERSYQLWAVEELAKCIEESEYTPPLKVVEAFNCRMHEYARRKGKAGVIFSIAHDVSTDIYDILEAME